MNPSRKTFLKAGIWGLAAIGGLATTFFVRKHYWANEDFDEAELFFATGHLKAKITIEQAESVERYADSLGGVSSVAFGHLHGAWKNFLSQKPVNGELWAFDSFDRQDSSPKSYRIPRRGYAWVVRGIVIKEIVVEG